MINIAYRLLLTITAASLLLIIYVVQKGFTLGYFFEKCTYLVELPNAISYAVYLLVPIALSGLSIFLSRYLGKDEFPALELPIQYLINRFRFRLEPLLPINVSYLAVSAV